MPSIVDTIFKTIPSYGDDVITVKKSPGASESDLPEISCFDYINLETQNVPYDVLTKEEQVGVASDERTVVLHFPSTADSYVCVDLEELANLAGYKNSKFYECRGSDNRGDARKDDRRGSSIIRVPFGPGGSYFNVFTRNFNEFMNSGDRIVSIITIPNSSVERTISEDALKQLSEGAYVSTNHCQSGSSLSLSYLAKTSIEGVSTLAKYAPIAVAEAAPIYSPSPSPRIPASPSPRLRPASMQMPASFASSRRPSASSLRPASRRRPESFDRRLRPPSFREGSLDF